MSSKKWLICFFICLTAVISTIAAFNIITDPFGIFGDNFYDWYELDMTNNPAASKIAYIDKNHDKYDSYIIGSSGTSSFPVSKLNEYTGAKFFNMFSYGADMEKTYFTSKYVLENYEVKNLVICVGIMDLVNFKKYGDSVTDGLHAKITGDSIIPFYAKYLFANPKYGMSKIDYYDNYNTYLPKFFDVFSTKTGAYDDRVVDIEHIGSLDAYLESKPAFKTENRYNPASKFPYIDECVDRIADIKNICDEKGVDLKVVFMPSYYELCVQLNMTRVAIFYNKLAQVTDFWDFFLSSASTDPRYFQDYMHIRNALGAMAISRVYGDENVYIPEDFGFYVTSENNAEYAGEFWNRLAEVQPEPDRTTTLDILMYHHISDAAGSNTIISAERFEEHLKALTDAGYNTVSVSDIIDFVEKGTALPEKALLLTFDDGYQSNYDYAFPILQKYNMKALVSPIGISMGTDKYRATNITDLPYFGWDEAREMEKSGIFEIGAHTYDMHLYPPAEPDPETCRQGVLQLADETEEEYITALRYDIEKFIEIYKENMGTTPTAFAFPYGKNEKLAEALLAEYGYKITFTTESGQNEIIKGLPQSLYGLNRYTVSGAMTGEDLINLINLIEIPGAAE